MYWTELMQKILQSDMGQKIVHEVAPVYGDGYVALWLFEVIGRALGDVEILVKDYQNQTMPQTATWTLPLWESRYGIVTDTSLSIEERRQRILLRQPPNRAPMNPRRLERIAAWASGAECRIEEHTGPNQFTLYVINASGTINAKRIRKAIDEAKQAHVIYKINDKTEIILDNSELEQIILQNISFKTMMPFWNCLLIDGSWFTDGSILLDAEMQPYNGALNIKTIKVESPEAIKNESLSIGYDLWYLNGDYKLDGEKLLDADEWKEAI